MAGRAGLVGKEEGTGFGGVSLIFLGAPNLVSLKHKNKTEAAISPRKNKTRKPTLQERKLLDLCSHSGPCCGSQSFLGSPGSSVGPGALRSP